MDFVGSRFLCFSIGYLFFVTYMIIRIKIALKESIRILDLYYQEAIRRVDENRGDWMEPLEIYDRKFNSLNFLKMVCQLFTFHWDLEFEEE